MVARELDLLSGVSRDGPGLNGWRCLGQITEGKRSRNAEASGLHVLLLDGTGSAWRPLPEHFSLL